MRKNKTAKRAMSIILSILMLSSALTAFAIPAHASTAHEGECQWADWYSLGTDADGNDYHYRQCIVHDACEEMNDFGNCVGKDDLWAICRVCENRMEHTCFDPDATCIYGGTCTGCGYGAPINPENHVLPSADSNDENTHKLYCSCGIVYNAEEPHIFPDEWDDVLGTDLEERWCTKCLYAQTRPKQSSGGNGSDTCEHSFSEATCTTPATCECGATQGEKNPQNHVGGTEIKNFKEATTTQEGYSGDIYCKGCDNLIESGNAIVPTEENLTPDTLFTEYEDILGSVGISFTSDGNLTLSKDTEITVSNFPVNAQTLSMLFEDAVTVGEDGSITVDVQKAIGGANFDPAKSYLTNILFSGDIKIGDTSDADGVITVKLEKGSVSSNDPNVQYIAMHIGKNGVSYGTVTVGKDGSITASFDVTDQSPFIILALTDKSIATPSPDSESPIGSNGIKPWVIAVAAVACVAVIGGGYAIIRTVIKKRRAADGASEE